MASTHWEGCTPEERERGDMMLTPDEGRVQFNRAVRRWMGSGGDEFIRHWDAGEHDEIADKDGHRHVMRLALLGGLAR